jgi:hypothetical protein
MQTYSTGLTHKIVFGYVFAQELAKANEPVHQFVANGEVGSV